VGSGRRKLRNKEFVDMCVGGMIKLWKVGWTVV